jgi:hypothetical protein
MPAAEIGTIRTVAATTTMATTATMSEAILSLTLVVPVRPYILLRLTAAGNESWKTTNILSAFMSRLARLLVWLRLMVRTIVRLLVARRKWLCVARQIRLLLRFTRGVVWFVLGEGLVVIVAIEAIVDALLLPAHRALRPARRALLLRLLIVVGILLTELLLRRGDQTEIMFGMLVVVLGGYRITGSLRVARELDIFFRDVRSSAADFDIGTV